MNLLFWYRSLMRSVGAALVKLIATATSGLVSFTTNVIRPVKVTCEFSPIQEGTGDPSPDNVRPISGWTGCEILHTGKNLIGYSAIEEGSINSTTGEKEADSSGNNTIRFIRNVGVNPNGSVTIRLTSLTSAKCWPVFFWYDKNGTYIGRTNSDAFFNVFTATVPANATSMNMLIGTKVAGIKSVAQFFTQYLPQLELGSTATAYEPYQGETLPITFTDPSTGDPLTVYGGTVTLNEDGSVDLVGDRAIITMNGTGPSSQGVSFNNKGSRRAADEYYTRINGKTSSSSQLFFGNICSHAPEAPTGEADELGIIYFRTYAPAKQSYHEPRLVFPHSMGIDTTAKANAWLATQAKNGTPVRYTYYIKNPVTYHFDNIGQLQSFLGTNNIWHNMNGDITVEYWNKQ